MKYSTLILSIGLASALLPASAGERKVTFTRSELTGIGVESAVMRRDPSDIIKVDGLYYVWYSKGRITTGYDATIWYATSTDGIQWTEKGEALQKGTEGSWEGASVFTPNILESDGKYYLFYTGTSQPYKKGSFTPDSKIGVAVSDSPIGPWQRSEDNPVIRNSSLITDFDSHLVDDACIIKRDGKYWLYYKGRQQGKTPRDTQMGVAIADEPSGPYVKSPANPVIPGNHEVVVYPFQSGVAALIGTTGPASITNSIMYAEDGLNFTKLYSTKKGAWAGGLTRSDLGPSGHPSWGVEITRNKNGSLPAIGRFDIKFPTQN